MSHCAKCGNYIGTEGGHIRRINVGSEWSPEGNRSISRDSLLCEKCADMHDESEGWRSIFVIVLIIVLNIFLWI